MANPIQQLILRLIRTVTRTTWSLVLLAITMGLGYFAGQRWGETQGDPNGMWYGLIGGLAVWALVLRPRRRRNRRGGGQSDYNSDHGGFDSGGGDDGGGDDGGGDD